VEDVDDGPREGGIALPHDAEDEKDAPIGDEDEAIVGEEEVGGLDPLSVAVRLRAEGPTITPSHPHRERERERERRRRGGRGARSREENEARAREFARLFVPGQRSAKVQCGDDAMIRVGCTESEC